MKLYKKFLITTLIFTLMSFFYVDAVENINFENITIDDGLSQSTVEVIFQSSQGYIWIGTNDGLNRYNGTEMKVYKADKTKKNTIASSYILSINEDKNNNLWVGTYNGISKINMKDNSIVNYTHYNNDINHPFNNVYEVTITKSGKILIGTYSGLYYYDETNDKFERILYKEGTLTSQEVYLIEEDKDNNIWIGTHNGLNKVDIKNKKVYKYDEEKYEFIRGTKINTILFDNDNNLWIGTQEKGLSKLNLSNNEITNYTYDENNSNSIPSETIKDLLLDVNGNMWIATYNGLSKYRYDDKFTNYHYKSYDSNSLCNDIVYDLMEDKSGLFWIGTYTGISTFDPANKIEYYKNDPLNDNSLSNNVVHGIYEDYEGLLWVGTRSKGLNIINRKTNKIDHIYEGNSEYDLSSNGIRVITGKENIIYIGTRNGLNILDKYTNKIEKINMKDGLLSDNIICLLLDSKGYLWIGTPDGVNILNTENKEIINITDTLKKHGMEDVYVEDIYEDKDGIYWLGNRVIGTLVKVDIKNQIIKVYAFNSKKDKNDVSSIRSITGGEGDVLWIGTNEGLVKFNKRKETYEQYTDKDGLSNNNVYGILIDSKDDLWMSTNNGLSKFNIKSETFNNWGSTEGLQSNEFNGKAYYKCRDGNMAFGGINGLNIFNPEDILKSSYIPTVTFDNFEVSGDNYTDIDGMEFKYNENLFRIKYFVSEYKKNYNVQYYYKLEGDMDEWILVNSNEIIFNKLQPGDYTLKIKARSQNGNMGKESQVSFKVNPPLWKTKEAMVIYILLLIIIIYRHITKVKRLDELAAKKSEALNRQMRKNNQLLNRILEEEKNKNNYFVNLSHELRTPLNVLNSLEQLITNFNKSEKGIPKDKLDHYMEIMNKNIRRLLNLINNIIDTTKIESGKYKIIKEPKDIVYIVEETALGLKDAIEAKGINLIIDTDVEEKIIQCDEYEIERCIVNLINNAYKFTPEGGSITVDIKDFENEVMIIVEDTGIGIDEKYHESIFDRFNQVIEGSSDETKGGSGLGLTITKHIIDLHGGKIYLESEKNIGTRFIIILPVG